MRINGVILIPISHSEETKTNCGNTGIRENASPAESAFSQASVSTSFRSETVGLVIARLRRLRIGAIN